MENAASRALREKTRQFLHYFQIRFLVNLGKLRCRNVVRMMELASEYDLELILVIYSLPFRIGRTWPLSRALRHVRYGFVQPNAGGFN